MREEKILSQPVPDVCMATQQAFRGDCGQMVRGKKDGINVFQKSKKNQRA